MQSRPLITYEPNPLLSWAYHRFFDPIHIDESWADKVRAAERQGTVVYVLRNLSVVDFLALDHLTKRFHLPQVRFANDLGLGIFEPMGRGWWNALATRSEDSDVTDLASAVRSGASAALFLKRPASLRIPKGVRRDTDREGDALFLALLREQAHLERPIILVPQVFMWSKRPDVRQKSLTDLVFGPREWPGNMRTVAQFLAHQRTVTLRVGEPVALPDVLKEGGPPSHEMVRRLTFTLLRRLERERRSVVGPTQKPVDRMRDEVLRSPRLRKVISDLAGEGEDERRVLTTRAEAMLREMEATVDPNAIAAFDQTLGALFRRLYSAIEVDQAGVEALRQASKEGTLVLLPSHKSHIDYLVLSYVFYHHHLPIPRIAAGDNLNFFPVGPLFRRVGAFFIRRKFQGDRLYAAVVDAYIRRLMKEGFPLEFFLEGGRSRTGKLLSPKLGMLSMVVDAAMGTPETPVHFCPVSISYERVVEENTFYRELTGGEKQGESITGLLQAVDVLRGRYGRVSVQFGKPRTLEAVLSEQDPNATLTSLSPPKRRALITRLAHGVMHEINQVTSVSPGSLVATVLLAHDKRGIPHAELVESAERLGNILRAGGARFSPCLLLAQDHISELSLLEALELFMRAGHVTSILPGNTKKQEGAGIAPGYVYVVREGARLALDLAKNEVLHFFVPRALISVGLLADRDGAGPRVPVDTLRERVLFLSRLFKFEFQFRVDLAFESIFDEELSRMIATGDLVSQDSHIASADPPRTRLAANILHNFLDGYRAAARTLSLLVKGPMTAKDLLSRAFEVSERMLLSGELHYGEARSRPLFENAYAAFVDLGYLRRKDGSFALQESFADAAAVATIEARIRAFSGNGSPS